MRAPLALRLLMIPLVWLPVGLVAWIYVSTHDLARSLRELEAGNKVTWPPAPTQGPHARADRRRRSPPRPRCRRGPPRRAAAGHPGPPGRRQPTASPPRAGAIDRAVGAAARTRRPRRALPRPRGLRGHHRRDLQPLVRADSGAAPTTSRSRSTASPTSRSASPSPPRLSSCPRSAGRWKTSTPTSS